MKLFECTFRREWNYFERYFDTNLGRSVVNQIYTRPEYYVEDSEGKYKYLLDEKIRLRKEIGRPPKDSGKVYGVLQSDSRHIRDKYWNIKKSNYNDNPCTWFIDIETTAFKGIDTDNTPEEVVLIQIWDTSKNAMIVLASREWRAKDQYTKDYDYSVNYIVCKNEIDIFEKLFQLIKKLNPLMVLGWNADGFDYPYLFNRAKKLRLRTDRFSPCYPAGKANLEQRRLDNGMVHHSLKADGIFYMDYMDIYKKYTYSPRSSYSLDNIAKIEVNSGKIDHSCYSTFDGFRTGEGYITPKKRPTDEWGQQMYDLQTKLTETKEPKAKAKIKTEISELANDLFVHYGIIDTYLLKLINDKKQFTKILLAIASKMGVNVDSTLGTVRPWASYIRNVAYLDKKIPPNDKVDENADTSIKGGFVGEPQAGKHRWVVSVDINSAYPNLSMRGFNMSAETFVPKMDLPEDLKEMNLKYFCDEDEESRFRMYIDSPEIFSKYTELLKKYNFSGSISGSIFSREKQGIIPELVERIYTERKEQKRNMLKWKQKAESLKNSKNFQDPECVKDYEYAVYMQNQFNTAQMVSKVLINSLYGALGNKYFLLFNVEIARSITSNTRFYIHLLNYRLNETLQKIKPRGTSYIVYGDTDSSYFSISTIMDDLIRNNPEADMNTQVDFADEFIEGTIQPVIDAVGDEFANCMNAFDKGTIKAEREVIADVAVFLAKKKYYMRVYDNEGVRYQVPDIKTMGVEIVRSSTPPFVVKHLKDSINIILDSTEYELKEWIKKTKVMFGEADLRDISKTSGVSNLDYDLHNVVFKNGRKVTIPINSRAALVHNEMIKNTSLSQRVTPISPGDKVKLLYLTLPNKINSNIIAYIDDVVPEQLRDDIDLDKCWDKFFMSAIDIMTAPLKWNLRVNTESLDEW